MGSTEDFINNFLNKARSVDGKIVGDDNEFIKSKLASDGKGAWVDHMVDQYLKKQVVDDPPIEFEITMKDIIREISKREINKLFGKQ